MKAAVLIPLLLWAFAPAPDTGGVDALSGATRNHVLEPMEVPPPCPEGEKAVTDSRGDYLFCVPAEWAERTRGSERVFSPGNGRDFVLAEQEKVSSADEVLAPLRAFAQKSGSRLKGRTDGKMHFSAGEVDIAVWAKHQHRYGVILYASCGGDSKVCRAFFAEADRATASFRFTERPWVLPYQAWTRKRTEHLDILVFPSTPAESDLEWIAGQYEAAYVAISATLGEDAKAMKVSCYFYPDLPALSLYTHRDSGFAMVEQGEIHSWYRSRSDRQTTGHEMVHVLAQRMWGTAGEALMGEGLAVALDQSGTDQHQRAVRALGDQGTSFQLNGLLGRLWFQADPELAYAVSGSFVRFLLDRYPVTTVRDLFTSSDLPSALLSLTGKSLSDLTEQWRKDSLGL